MMWVILTSSKRNPEKILADAHVEDFQATNQLKVYHELNDAEKRKETIERKWPHLKVFIIDLYSEANP